MPRFGKQSHLDKPKSEFDQAVIEVARVTRVQAGGKRMRFRASVVVGNKHGKVGMAVAKGADVQLAVAKAVTQAQKHIMVVPIIAGTVPHAVYAKFNAAKVLIKPAALGTGVIAGGSMRKVLELAGIENVIGKMLGSSNKINNIRATLKGLSMLKDEVPQHMVRANEEHAKIVAERQQKAQAMKAMQSEDALAKPSRGGRGGGRGPARRPARKPSTNKPAVQPKS